MGIVATALILPLLNQVFIANALSLTNSMEAQFKISCFTNRYIICDKGLVRIGICCTKDDRLDIVYGLCPYIILTDQEVYDHDYYRINFSVPEQSCDTLNRS